MGLYPSLASVSPSEEHFAAAFQHDAGPSGRGPHPRLLCACIQWAPPAQGRGQEVENLGPQFAKYPASSPRKGKARMGAEYLAIAGP